MGFTRRLGRTLCSLAIAGVVVPGEHAGHNRQVDEDLAVEIELWGLKMTRGKLLWEVVKHEAHHRGQIFTLMRLAGLRVHGIYGPSKEEVDAMAASGTVSG